jgi:hypothetical protein
MFINLLGGGVSLVATTDPSVVWRELGVPSCSDPAGRASREVLLHLSIKEKLLLR